MTSPHLSRLRRLIASGLLVAALTPLAAMPVFPGAVGFGTNQATPPGRGGTVYKVTSLANSGPGTLREFVENRSGARVIVFEVSGVIDLQTFLSVDNGNVTIAGQTAPAPGITLKNYGLLVRSSNVLVQHLASRPGIAAIPSETDSFTAGTGGGVSISNIVFDHVSASWNTDETVSTYGSTTLSVQDVTFINCIFSEAVQGATGTPHSGFGPLAGRNTARTSFVRNIFALNSYRNPLIRDTVSSAQVVDNLIYRPNTCAECAIAIGTAGSNSSLPLVVSAVGNVIIRGPDSGGVSSIGVFAYNGCSTNTSVYLNNNHVFDPTGSGTWYPTDGNPYSPQIYRQGTPNPTELGADPHTSSGVVSWGYSPAVLESTLKQAAGKHPAMRDVIDANIISRITGRTGTTNKNWSAIQTEYGTNPWAGVNIQNTRALSVPASPHDVMLSGYTRLEEWLHGWSATVEGTTGIDPLVVKSDDFSDGNANGWTPSGTQDWSVVLEGSNHVYKQTLTTGDAVSVLTGTNWTNYTIDARAKVHSYSSISGSLASLYARHQDSSNYYTFMLLNTPGVGTSVAIKKRVNGTVSTLGTTVAQPVSLDTWYTLRFDVSGSNLNGYVNGALVISRTDSSLAVGRAGVSTYKASASFDDFVATPVGAAVVAVAEDFQDSVANGWTASAGTWSFVTDGSLVYRQSSTAGLGQSTVGAGGTNHTIEADYKPISFNGASVSGGLLARWVNGSNYYYLGLYTDNTLRLVKQANGGSVLLQSVPHTVTANTWYSLKLSAIGTMLTGYVNGQLKVQMADSTHSSSTTGISTWKTSASFDDVVVTRP